jgi:hypothetical protein
MCQKDELLIMLNFVRYRAQFEGRDNEMISGFSELDRSTAANDTDSLQHGNLGEIAI